MTPHAAELLELARLADQEKPFIKEKLCRLQSAAAEEGPAGELRRAIHKGPFDVAQLEQLSGVELRTIGRFLEGDAISLSEFERLANALGLDVSLTKKSAPTPQPVGAA
jgi:hypothetical protein